jgi:ubiquitin-like-conjugating enzyme ATG10
MVLERASCTPALYSLFLFTDLEIQTLPGFGYMHRIITLNWRHSASVDAFLEIDDNLDIIDDGTTASHDSSDSLTCHQYVVLSATFRVPAFYFIIHGSSTCN